MDIGASMAVAAESARAVAQVSRGHWLLVVCAALYLFWWAVFFRPGAQARGALRGAAIAAILLAAVCGVWGLIDAGIALPWIGSVGGVPLWVFAVCGVVAYAALAGVTQGLFHRQLTTELLLIVLWAAFELAVACRLGAGAIPMGVAVALLILTVVLFVGSMVCYVLYYRLPAWPAFLAGCAPLVAVGVEAAAIAVLTSI
ncbi:hypothetical protein H7U32_07040 [Bifidobacterium pullorum subsp. saeculare]|uniref:Uncharacterized protein n=1 Tax=Bifidobacterium pullorum subsp. saeculare TaxID=78257 RepID=A0A938WYK4_9BIFI|nr:hypothetical protein [Bifidobacterium pullorum]MBM6700057.1 hypothetical protein [Bifidobacterium pullorum subsp. saeculare]